MSVRTRVRISSKPSVYQLCLTEHADILIAENGQTPLNLPFKGETSGQTSSGSCSSPQKDCSRPITFLSPDNGGTEGGVKTIEEPERVVRRGLSLRSLCASAMQLAGFCEQKLICGLGNNAGSEERTYRHDLTRQILRQGIRVALCEK